MITKPDESIYRIEAYWDNNLNKMIETHPGLTKLEYFAGIAMQGIISSYPNFGDLNEEFVARVAVTHAKALIAELNKEPHGK
jgi:NADPH-dependent curcumin reductase CurA